MSGQVVSAIFYKNFEFIIVLKIVVKTGQGRINLVYSAFIIDQAADGSFTGLNFFGNMTDGSQGSVQFVHRFVAVDQFAERALAAVYFIGDILKIGHGSVKRAQGFAQTVFIGADYAASTFRHILEVGHHIP